MREAVKEERVVGDGQIPHNMPLWMPWPDVVRIAALRPTCSFARQGALEGWLILSWRLIVFPEARSGMEGYSRGLKVRIIDTSAWVRERDQLCS